MPVARWTATISELKGFRQIGRQRGYHGGMTDRRVKKLRPAVYQDILKIHARVLATLGIETHRSRGFNLFSPTIFP